MTYKLNILIEKYEDGFYAYCPELLVCRSQGDTLAEATQNIKEAVELYLETLSEKEATELVVSYARSSTDAIGKLLYR